LIALAVLCVVGAATFATLASAGLLRDRSKLTVASGFTPSS
jgi:hypothetical protein